MAFWEEMKTLSLRTLGAAGGVMNDWAKGSLSKAETEGPESTPKGSQADSAESNPVPDKPTDKDPKSLFWDPFAIVEQLGYKDRPSFLTYGTLKSMVYRCPVVHAIINTRVKQVAAFAQPQHDRYQLGYRIKLRESDKEPSKAEKDWIAQSETLIQRTGVTDNPRGRADFETFLNKLVWDSLVYDQMCFEVVPDQRGVPCEWYPVDAATIRLADSASTYIDEDENAITRYVQIYDGMVIAEYNQEELCFGVRNPRTDIRLFGYGVSELEMLITTVTSILWGLEYNQRFFSQGSAVKGILNFKGAIPENQLQAFRRHWYMMASGVENSFRTPITNAEELQWINMQQSNRDMEFSAYFDFLIKIAAAIFVMDPTEINFKYGNTGQRGGLQEASNKEKITESKERGLRPLLRFLERCINQHIIWPINENFEFDFVGLDALTRDEIATLNQKRVKTFLTVDELRAEDDLPPLPDGKGEIILDPTWLQWAQLKEGGGMGMPGEGGDMGEGEPGEGEGDEEMDFETLLAQMDEDEGKEGKEKKEKVEKSLTRLWEVTL